jgi:hypothetical protein
MKKLLFVYEHSNPTFWLDGLNSAIHCLEQDFEVTWFNLLTGNPDDVVKADFVLGWGGFNSKVDKFIQELQKWSNAPDHDVPKFGLCIAGNAFPYSGQKYDVLFYETNWVRDFLNLTSIDAKIVKAFGINTDIFNEVDFMTPLVFDYIGVGAFAKWKRWEKMKDKKGIRLVVGEYQKDNDSESGDITRDLIRNGVIVSGMVHPLDLANFYHWSKTLYMPADIYGGGERTVLEARACGLRVEVEDDNPKLQELLMCKIPSHLEYAYRLKEGILSCL